MRIRQSHLLMILLAAALGSSSMPAAMSAQQTAVAPAKVALIRRVLELTKVADVAVSAMEAAIPSQRLANPQIPAEFWGEFMTCAGREIPRLLDLLVPIYDAQFTTAQLEQLIEFYQSPAGKRLVAVQPAIAVQSMQAGQEWGARVGSQVVADLARRGIQIQRRR